MDFETLGIILRLLTCVGRVLAFGGPTFHSLIPTFNERVPNSPYKGMTSPLGGYLHEKLFYFVQNLIL
jgi:hypothetical protein